MSVSNNGNVAGMKPLFVILPMVFPNLRTYVKKTNRSDDKNSH